MSGLHESFSVGRGPRRCHYVTSYGCSGQVRPNCRVDLVNQPDLAILLIVSVFHSYLPRDSSGGHTAGLRRYDLPIQGTPTDPGYRQHRKKKPSIQRDWLKQARQKLSEARETWQELRIRYPNRFNYELRLREIDRAERRLNRLANPQPGLRISTQEISTEPDLPDLQKVSGSDTQPQTTAGTDGDTDGWTWEDYFFEDEGVVAAELPGESKLTVSGRESVQFQLQQTSFPNSPDKEDESSVNIDQQLQFDVRGSVADERLVVDMKFNGSLPAVERQSIEVQYNGLERDVGFGTSQTSLQFGDINLSLPNTNFVSYNKSVFGLRGQSELTDVNIFGWEPNKFTLYGVASQEEGESQKKVFQGKSRRRIPEPLPDIQPIRRRYYQLLADTPEASRPSIEVNSEQIYLDDQTQENNDDNTIEKTVSNGGDTYFGRFDELVSGDDYSIDYQSGVVRFKRNIRNNHVLAVTMTLSNGTEITDFMFKDQNESDTFDKYHLRNRYQLAGQNLVRNDPDRVLEIRDASGRAAPENNPNTTYNELLGLDQNSDGVIDDQFIDFELGILRFPDTRPFVSASLGNAAETNPTVYGPPANREEIYNIYQEVLTQENTYRLDFNVVQGSENITVDGQQLVKNRDYTIDYQTGFIQFFDRVNIDEESRIEIDYETQGLGNQRDETFLGGRVEADISENLSMGSTLLSDQESELGRVPQVGEETQSTLVNEFDISWNPLHTTQDILADWIGLSEFNNRPWDDQLTFDVNAEWASSTREPNQAGRAVVDDFQNLDQRAPISKGEFDWTPADPVQQFPGPQSVLQQRAEIEFDEEEGEGFDPDPDNDEDEQQNSLRVNISPDNNQDTWTSFQQLFAEDGRDLRGYQFIEVWVKWEGNTEAGTMSLDLGQTTEEVNRNSNLETEDENNDDVLNPGEDDGIPINLGTGQDFQFGSDDGRLTTEDLDGNGFVDRDESYLHFPDINKSSAVDTKTTSHGWTRYRVPLNPDVFGELRGNSNLQGSNLSDTPTLDEVLQNAETLRMVYETPGGSADRSFLLDQMGVVRTSWRTDSDSSLFSLDVVSEAGETSKLPAPGHSGFTSSSNNQLTKALGISYNNMTASDSGVTSTVLNRPQANRLNIYKELDMLFNVDSADAPDSGYLRFGTNDENFFQYTFDLENPGSDPRISNRTGDWYELSIDLTQFEDDLIRKSLSGNDVFRSGQRLIRGSPSLREIKQYRIGLVGPNMSSVSGEMLIGRLSTSGVIDEEGDAVQVSSDVNVRNGLLDLDLRKRDVDGEFRTIGLVNSATANRFVQKDEESRNVSGSVDINRYIPSAWGISIPFSFNWSDQETRLPADRAERVRSDELGTITNESLNWSSGLNTPSLYPDFSVSWDEQTKNVDQQRRGNKWDNTNNQLDLGANYSISFNDPILGYLPVGNGLSISSDGSITQAEEKRNVDTGSTKERDRETETRTFNMSLDAQPYGWLSINPGYEFRDRNRRTLQGEGLDFKNQNYDFSMNIDPGAYLGFDPSYDFTLSGSEEFTSDNFASKNRSINLSGNTNLRIQTTPTAWTEYLDFLSMSYNYSVSNSANYENVPQGNGIIDAYNDFFGSLQWLVSGANLEVTGDSLSLARNQGSFQATHRLSGDLDFWDPLSTSYNIQTTENKGQTDNSVNQSSASSFSLNNRFQLRRMVGWFNQNTNSASFRLNYDLSLSESANQDNTDHNVQLGLNTRWNKWWSTNFNLNTTLGQSNNQEVTTNSQQINPSLDFKWLVNESREGGTLWFDNRLEINGGLSASITERTQNGEIEADNQQISGNMGGAYNFSEWIKTRFSVNYSQFTDNFREANDEQSYGAQASVDFRF